jgi:ubiquitin-conjugating enzyme E2 W
VKEMSDIRNNGTPDGIAVHSLDSLNEWIFTISVLGDDTVYRVRPSPPLIVPPLGAK